MAEAIIGRSGVALSSGGGVSNETKKSLGLDNNATLDDVINTIVAKDPTMATMIVTIKNPDGTIPPESTKIKMVPVSGSTLEYSTNSVGQCLFKTNSGQCNFVETGDVPYIDLAQNSINNYAAVVGEVYHIDLVRKTKIGQSINLNSNRNIMFSSACKSVDIHCYGSGGGGGGGSSLAYTTWTSGTSGPNSQPSGGYGGSGGRGYYNNFKLSDIKPYSNYNIFIGDGGYGGSGGSSSGSSNISISGSSWDRVYVPASGSGGSGGSGGIVSFSDLVSARGGSGGGGSSSGSTGSAGSGGNGASGGSGGGYGAYLIEGSYEDGRYYDVRVVGYGSAGGKGSNGYIILNNFAYK